MKKSIKRFISCITVFMLISIFMMGCSNGGGQTSDTITSKKSGSNSSDKLIVAMAHRNLLSVTGADIRAAAYLQAEQENVEIKFFDANGDVEAQANFIEDCLGGQQVKAIMLWTADAEGIAESVRECNKKGIPVVSVDIPIPDAKVVNHVASDNIKIGQIAGKKVVEYLVEKNGSEKGTIVACTSSSLDSLRQRMQGFEEVINQYPEIEIKVHEMVTTTIDDGIALADDLMQLYGKGDVDVFFGANVSPTLGVITAAQTYNRDDFAVVGVDHDPNLVSELQKGEGNSVLLGFVAQDPYNIGEVGMRQTIKAAKGEDTGEKLISTNVTMVTADNIQEYLDTYNQYSEKVKEFK